MLTTGSPAIQTSCGSAWENVQEPYPPFGPVPILPPSTNLVANVYDVAPDGRAVIVSRGAHLVREQGEQHARVDLYGQDWLFKKGHRIGVLLSGANSEWWNHLPTHTEVEITSAVVGLPFMTRARTAFLDGTKTSRLNQHLLDAFVTVSSVDIKARRSTFQLPRVLTSAR